MPLQKAYGGKPDELQPIYGRLGWRRSRRASQAGLARIEAKGCGPAALDTPYIFLGC